MMVIDTVNVYKDTSKDTVKISTEKFKFLHIATISTGKCSTEPLFHNMALQRYYKIAILLHMRPAS